jgi:hypothetical protein
MNPSEKKHIKFIYNRLLRIHLEPSRVDYMVRLKKIIDAPDDQAAMLTAFRHAANSIGVEAGITKDHVSHKVAVASVCEKDGYYLDLIRGAEQRMGLERISFEHQTTLLNSCEKALADRDVRIDRLSVKYERLRLLASRTLQAHDQSSVDWDAMRKLKEALSND